MITTVLKGGLGNQLFQYACGLALSVKHNKRLVLDTSHYSKNHNTSAEHPRHFELYPFNITAQPMGTLDKIWLRTHEKVARATGSHMYERVAEAHFHFDPNLSEKARGARVVSLDGYWQSFKYFENIRSKLLKEFKLRNKPNEKNAHLLQRINDENSISLHVRRGDYVSLAAAASFHGVTSTDFYRRALEHLQYKENEHSVFVFSDDPDWCEANLSFISKKTVVNHNGLAGWEDLRLMSACKSNIIANSTFSWWGAWLNQNPHKLVVAPKKWFNHKEFVPADLFPKEWILLE